MEAIKRLFFERKKEGEEEKAEKYPQRVLYETASVTDLVHLMTDKKGYEERPAVEIPTPALALAELPNAKMAIGIALMATHLTWLAQLAEEDEEARELYEKLSLDFLSYLFLSHALSVERKKSLAERLIA